MLIRIGQLAIVTGATSALGEATAVRLARLAAAVALIAPSAADLERVAGKINTPGDEQQATRPTSRTPRLSWQRQNGSSPGRRSHGS
jgi:NADP-dependent 3-hydroxy acid dehydrogenase YdfG